MFCNFCEKFKSSKWPSFLLRQKFFENWNDYSEEIPCGSKISSKYLYLARFSRYSIFVFCNFCEKFENSKWCHIWRNNIFLKIGMVTLQGYPVVQKFRQNPLYLARFSSDKHFCVFLIWKIRNDELLGHFLTKQCQNLMISRF